MSEHRTPTSAGRRRLWLPLASGIVMGLIAAGIATPQPASASAGRTIAAPTKQVSPSPGIGTQASAQTATGPLTVGPNLPCEGCFPDPPCYPTYEYCPKFYVTCKPTITTTQSRGYDSVNGEYLVATPSNGRYAMHDLLRAYAIELTHGRADQARHA